jgi:soluble lytic murein transglycosylase-like protein
VTVSTCGDVRVLHGVVAAALLIGSALSVGCPDTTDPRVEFLDGWLEGHAPRLSAGSRGRVVDALLESEDATGVDAFLLLAVIEEESRYDPSARSRRGARGLTQLLPETARDVAARAGVVWSGPDDLSDPATNVRLGAAYLAEMKEQFGPWTTALSAYHSGPTRIRRIEKGGGRIPTGYSSSVLRRHRRIHEAFNEPRP